MIELLNKIAAKFRGPKDPQAKYFESLKELREFQRKNPGYIGPLCVMLDAKVEDK